MIEEFVPVVSGYYRGALLQIIGTIILVLVAYRAQDGVKLCKRFYFMESC